MKLCSLLFGLVLSYFIVPVTSDNWAVIVAGSSGWDNYRHQADACHAYQILHKEGFPDDRIIMFMADDIANNTANPYPGNIINQPNGSNVYPGVLKDYTGDLVTPQNFINVLMGNKSAMSGVGSGKVLESTTEDDVFIYFADHGGPYLIAFPNECLFAHQLNDVLTYMYDNHMYRNLVFYMEACESGSMFQNILSPDINVYVTTASNPQESSYACYYDEERKTYLGDVYSVYWLQNSTPKNISDETLEQQFKLVKNETNTSHVSQYGNLLMSKFPVKTFLKYNDTLQNTFDNVNQFPPVTDVIDSRNVEMDILTRKFYQYSGTWYELLIYDKIEYLKDIMNFFDDYFVGTEPYYGEINTKCLQQIVKTMENNLPYKFSDASGYGMKYLWNIATLCKT
jgi:legumain